MFKTLIGVKILNVAITRVWHMQCIEVEVKIKTANQVSFCKNLNMHSSQIILLFKKMMQKKLVLIILSQSLFELLLKRPALLATAEHTLQAVEEAWRRKKQFHGKRQNFMDVELQFLFAHVCSSCTLTYFKVKQPLLSTNDLLISQRFLSYL